MLRVPRSLSKAARADGLEARAAMARAPAVSVGRRIEQCEGFMRNFRWHGSHAGL
jgi:hypothetical protein